MAVKLIANYAKRLGLPGYSSHQFSVSCETELTDLAAVSGEASRLYALLQGSVDREIQQVGFVPGDEYGLRDATGPPSRPLSRVIAKKQEPAAGEAKSQPKTPPAQRIARAQGLLDELESRFQNNKEVRQALAQLRALLEG